MPENHRHEIISEIIKYLQDGETKKAARIACKKYKPKTSSPAKRPSISQSRKLRIFIRDGFIDRYFGTRLIFPGTLLLLGKLLPEEFPMG